VHRAMTGPDERSLFSHGSETHKLHGPSPLTTNTIKTSDV
jgi:hypothetical protein